MAAHMFRGALVVDGTGEKRHNRHPRRSGGSIHGHDERQGAKLQLGSRC